MFVLKKENIMKKLIQCFALCAVLGFSGILLTACGDKPQPVELIDSYISLEYTSVDYNGNAHEPEVTITIENQVIDNEFYTVTYENNTNAGEASVVISANDENGVILGSITKNFTINKINPTNITFPTELTAEYGQTLADVKIGGVATALPTGFAWDLNQTTSVGDVGANQFKMWYIHSDAVNYNQIFEMVTVTVSVGDIAIPTANTATFTYTGSAQTYTPVGFDSNLMDISGNIQTTAGTHTVTVSLKDPINTKWADNTTTDKTFDFVIAPQTVTPPAEPVANNFTFDGSAQTYTPAGFDADIMNITGNVQTNAGTYTVTVSLKDKTNYVWAGATPSTADKTFSFVINAIVTAVPTATNSTITYTGSLIPLALTGFEPAIMTITGDTGTDVDNYTATITLNSNFKWDLAGDAATEPVEIDWEITPAELAVPTIASKTYSGDLQTADITATENYLVTTNAGGTDAGVYDVVLTLIANAAGNYNYEWIPATGVEIDGEVATIPFEITKANNTWAEEPFFNNKIYDGNPHSASDYSLGTPTVNTGAPSYAIYIHNGTEFVEWEGTGLPEEMGSYKVVLSYPANNNYNALEAETTFDIAPYYVSTFEELQEALGYLPSEQFIQLTADLEATAQILITGEDAERNITIDLNGHDIIAAGENNIFRLQNYADGSETTPFANAINFTILSSQEQSTLSVAQGTGTGVSVRGENVTVVATNINFEGYSYAYVTNGNVWNDNSIATFTNCSFTATGINIADETAAVYLASNYTTTFENCVFEGHVAMYLKGGETSISGANSSFTATAPEVAKYHSYGNGFHITGDAIVADTYYTSQNINPSTILSVDSTITNEMFTVTAQDAQKIAQYNYNNTLAVINNESQVYVFEQQIVGTEAALNTALEMQNVNILITADIQVSEQILITGETESRSITIDLNGHDITSAGSNNIFRLQNYADGAETTPFENPINFIIFSGSEQSTLSVAQGTGTGISVRGEDVTVVATNINFEGYSYAYVTNGNVWNDNSIATFTNCSFTATGINIADETAAVYLASNYTTTFENCVFEGHVAMYLKGGETSISGANSSFTATAPEVAKYHSYGNGFHITGDAIVADTYYTSQNINPSTILSIDETITSDMFTVTAAGAHNIAQYNYNNTAAVINNEPAIDVYVEEITPPAAE